MSAWLCGCVRGRADTWDRYAYDAHGCTVLRACMGCWAMRARAPVQHLRMVARAYAYTYDAYAYKNAYAYVRGRYAHAHAHAHAYSHVQEERVNAPAGVHVEVRGCMHTRMHACECQC